MYHPNNKPSRQPRSLSVLIKSVHPLALPTLNREGGRSEGVSEPNGFSLFTAWHSAARYCCWVSEWVRKNHVLFPPFVGCRNEWSEREHGYKHDGCIWEGLIGGLRMVDVWVRTYVWRLRRPFIRSFVLLIWWWCDEIGKGDICRQDGFGGSEGRGSWRKGIDMMAEAFW